MSSNAIPSHLEPLHSQWTEEEQRNLTLKQRGLTRTHLVFTAYLMHLLSTLDLPTETKELIFRQDELLYRKALSETSQAR